MVVEKNGEKDEIFKNTDKNASTGIVSGLKEKFKEKYEDVKDGLAEVAVKKKVSNSVECAENSVGMSEESGRFAKSSGSTDSKGKDSNLKDKAVEKYEDIKIESNLNEGSESSKKKVSNGAEYAKNKYKTNKHEENDAYMEGEQFHSAEEGDINHDREKQSKSVDFNEGRNTEHKVEKNANKSIPGEVERRNVSAAVAKNLQNGSSTSQTSNGDSNIHEGEAFKKRRFFSCFWTKRHFLLTADGLLKYKKSMAKSECEFLNIKEVEVVSKVDRERQSHPYQIVMTRQNREKVLAFDSVEERDSWASKISNLTKNIREDK